MGKWNYYFKADNLLKGNLGVDFVKAILETSGYTVCPYGWEATLLDAMSNRTFKKSNSKTGRRIRKSPDLLVYDAENILLVEVKTRMDLPPRLNLDEIEILKEYWNDSILVFVVPDDNVFYAQKVSDLEIQQSDLYPLAYFKKLEEIFPKVQAECISHFRDISLQILQVFKTKKETSEN